jgi:hypothetical protein
LSKSDSWGVSGVNGSLIDTGVPATKKPLNYWTSRKRVFVVVSFRGIPDLQKCRVDDSNQSQAGARLATAKVGRWPATIRRSSLLKVSSGT